MIGQCEQIQIQGIRQMIMPHYDPEVDLAVLDCTALFSRFPDHLYFKAFSYDMLATFDEPELSGTFYIY